MALEDLQSQKLKQNTGHILSEVENNGKEFVVTQWGRRRAVLLPLETYYQWRQWEGPRCPRCNTPLPIDVFSPRFSLRPERVIVQCDECGESALIERFVLPQVRLIKEVEE